MTTERRSKTLLIQERFSTRGIEAMFSNYRDTQQAVFDLVDNAVDNRIDGKPLTVRVRTSRNELSISNHGGQGLSLEGLTNYFTWGYSDKPAEQRRLGQYGVGGKSAMGFLGRGMEIICSADGSDIEYKVFDPSWETREGGEFKKYSPEQRKATGPEGYCRVRVIDLKREINAQALSAKFADVYRPLLTDGSIQVTVNGKKVDPLDIRYVEDTADLAPEHKRYQTKGGDLIELKVGVLEAGQRIKPGIRLYYRGRLMDDEQFFGHPSPVQMSASSRLIGEAHLDFVPIMTNKSDFNRSSVQWDQASRVIQEILSPWMEKLATLRSSDRTPVEQYERELARSAKRVLEHVLANQTVITRKLLPGSATGRLPAVPQGTIYPPEKGGTHRSTEGETSPKLTARGEKTKRWGAFHEVEPVSMGTPLIRAAVTNKDGRLKLSINSDYSLYQAARKIGEDAQEMYMLETLVMELVRQISKDKPVDDYMDLVNDLLKDCGEILRNKVRDRSRKPLR